MTHIIFVVDGTDVLYKLLLQLLLLFSLDVYINPPLSKHCMRLEINNMLLIINYKSWERVKDTVRVRFKDIIKDGVRDRG